MPRLYDSELQDAIQCCGSLYIWSVPNKPLFWYAPGRMSIPKLMTLKT